MTTTIKRHKQHRTLEELNDKGHFHSVGRLLIVILLVTIGVVQLFPYWLEFVTSLQPTEGFEPTYGSIYLWPVSINFGNYVKAFEIGHLWKGMANTMIVAVVGGTLRVICIMCVAYTISKKKFRLKRVVEACLLGTMMVPGQILMISNYQLVSWLGWMSSFAGLTLVGIIDVSGILLLVAYMRDNIPDSCLEAAKIEGASEFRIIVQIVFPMCAPILFTYIIMFFIGSWNDYLWPMIITGDENLYTLQLMLMNFGEDSGAWSQSVYKSAACLSTVFPLLIVYLLCQKQFFNGFNFSSDKE